MTAPKMSIERKLIGHAYSTERRGPTDDYWTPGGSGFSILPVPSHPDHKKLLESQFEILGALRHQTAADPSERASQTAAMLRSAKPAQRPAILASSALSDALFVPGTQHRLVRHPVYEESATIPGFDSSVTRTTIDRSVNPEVVAEPTGGIPAGYQSPMFAAKPARAATTSEEPRPVHGNRGNPRGTLGKTTGGVRGRTGSNTAFAAEQAKKKTAAKKPSTNNVLDLGNRTKPPTKSTQSNSKNKN